MCVCYTQPVFWEDFEIEGDANSFYHSAFNHERLNMDTGTGVNGSVALRSTYVGYSRGSMRNVINHTLPVVLEEATLNFDVKFEDNFQWVKGGKLLGFAPVNKITGGNAIEPDGWSARASFKENGTIKNYTYHQDQSGQYGEGGTEVQSFNFNKDEYYAMSYHVRVNNPPESSNGFSHIYINGELISRQDNLQLRGVGGDATLINIFLFSTFHGGSDPSWAPRNSDGSYATVYSLFDNIAVHIGQNIRNIPGLETVSVHPWRIQIGAINKFQIKNQNFILYTINGRYIGIFDPKIPGSPNDYLSNSRLLINIIEK